MRADSPLQVNMSGGPMDVLFVAVGMAVIALVLWALYRTLDRPRLPLNRPTDGPPFATGAGLARYLVTTPVMVTFWFLAVVLLVSFGTDSRDAVGVALASAAVVGGARLLAHASLDLANEVAKTVPIAILTFIVVGGGATDESLATIVDGLDGGLLIRYWAALIVLDIVITGLWYVLERRRWRRRGARPGLLGGLRQRYRRIGYVGA